MTNIRLFHFSEDPAIEAFTPRPVRVPAPRPPGLEWLNGSLVWAIDENHQSMYLFPRDCPRILVWGTHETTERDRSTWLGKNERVAYIERHRLEELNSTILYRYEFPAGSFEDLRDAGMWVSKEAITPIRCETNSNLREQLVSNSVELRIVDSLIPFRSLWNTTLHVSGIRLRNAVGWKND